MKLCTRCKKPHNTEFKSCESCRTYTSNHSKANRDHKTATKRKWRNDNKDRVNPQRRKQRKFEREVLADNYIKSLIRDKHPDIPVEDIPANIIKAWKLNLLLKRKITEHNAKFDRRFKRLSFPIS